MRNALRLAKYVIPFAGLVPMAFGISFGLGKMVPEAAMAALGHTSAIHTTEQPARGNGRSSSRVALVIGNADYPDINTPLGQVVSDAQALADALRDGGFDVDMRENLGKAEMRRAIESFKERIRPGAAALISYGGFGVQVGRQSYMVPVDAQIWKEEDVRREAIGIDSLLAEMHDKGASVQIAILDASRRNPFDRRYRGYSSGLAAIEGPQGTLLLSAAAPGKVAYDVEGSHNLLMGAVLKEIAVPGVSAEAAFNRTRISVSRLSNGEQVPLVASSLIENFAFMPAAPRYADTRPTEALDTVERMPTHHQGFETKAGQDADVAEMPRRPTPAPRIADNPPKKTTSTRNGSEYELASRPVGTIAPAIKETAKVADEVKRSRRSVDEIGRDLVRDRPCRIIKRGAWYSSSIQGERSWKVAANYPRHAISGPMVGIAY